MENGGETPMDTSQREEARKRKRKGIPRRYVADSIPGVASERNKVIVVSDETEPEVPVPINKQQSKKKQQKNTKFHLISRPPVNRTGEPYDIEGYVIGSFDFVLFEDKNAWAKEDLPHFKQLLASLINNENIWSISIGSDPCERLVVMFSYKDEEENTAKEITATFVQNINDYCSITRSTVYLLKRRFLELKVTNGVFCPSEKALGHLTIDIAISLEAFTANDKLNPAMIKVMSFCYPHKGETNVDFVQEFNSQRFYESLSARKGKLVVESITAAKEQHRFLQTEMRPYQMRALNWMVEKEKSSISIESPLWEEYTTIDKRSRKFYYSPTTGQLSLDSQSPTITYEPRGGILADEMGLGKTLEVIGLILEHPRSDFTNSNTENPTPSVSCYCGATSLDHEKWVQCNGCKTSYHANCAGVFESNQEKFQCFSHEACILQSQATIIVCPDILVKQWLDEFEKHLMPDTLKIYHYQGVQKEAMLHDQRGDALKLARKTAKEIAKSDVIITSYWTLRKELEHILKPPRYPLRQEKKFCLVPSPLTLINFWRICLDESQLVESDTKHTKMVSRHLSSVNRWCITGTPIQTRLFDLYGLVRYLEVPIYSYKFNWKNLVELPYEKGYDWASDRLHNLLSSLLWRTQKKDVVHEIRIPPQHEHVIKLDFSPVERHFYKKQHEGCLAALNSNIRKHCYYVMEGDSESCKISISDENFKNMIRPLLSLRQACCHPQVGKNKFQSLQENVMTMDELLKSLIQKANVECNEAIREVVCALNGMAAILTLENQIPEACQIYEEIISLSRTFNGRVVEPQALSAIYKELHLSVEDLRRLSQNNAKIRVDDLQKAHAFHNLASYIGTNPAIKYSAEELSAEEQAAATHYTRDSGAKATFHKDLRNEAQEKIQQLFANSGLNLDEVTLWGVAALSLIESLGSEASEEIMQKIREISFQYKDFAFYEIRSITGLKAFIANKIGALLDARNDLETKVQKLLSSPSSEDATKVGSCLKCGGSSRSIPRPRTDSCFLCKIESAIHHYESLLYYKKTKKGATSRRFEKEDDLLDITAFGDSMLDLMLKSILSTLSLIKRRNLAKANSETEEEEVDEELDENIDKITPLGKKYFEYIELLKKERKITSTLYTAYKDLCLSLDEVNVGKTKIELAENDEFIPEYLRPFKVYKGELVSALNIYKSQKIASALKFKEAKGQLLYLYTLHNKQNNNGNDAETKKSEEDEQCPVCYDDFGPQIVYLACGHRLCALCAEDMINRSVRGYVKCPFCRISSNTKEMSYIVSQNLISSAHITSNSSTATESPVQASLQSIENKESKVAGSFGTKLDAVVRTLNHIKTHYPGEKTLIFSQWAQVLNVVARALQANDISFKNPIITNQLSSEIQAFKKDPESRVLLLPIQHAGLGLTLIECSHVILVEPLLNPGKEAQTVSRVHRIGQTRETHVYRLIIKDSIEESIYNLMCKKRQTQQVDKEKRGVLEVITIDDLDDLFGFDIMGVNKRGPQQHQEKNPASVGNNAPQATQSKHEQECEPMELSENEKRREQERQWMRFWNTQVVMRDDEITRGAALVRLETAHSWETKSSRSRSEEQKITLHGREVSLVVAHQLLQLPTAGKGKGKEPEDQVDEMATEH